MTIGLRSWTLRRWAVLAAALLALASLQLGCATLDERQRAWIFQPSERSWAGAAAAAEGMADVWVDYHATETDDGGESDVRLHGLWLDGPRPDAPVLLYLHGARFDVRSSAPRMRRLNALGFAVLGIDYRGFGRSTAALPSEAMALEDARAAWAWLGQTQPRRARYVFGHSLGGAIAVALASGVDDASGLIVEGGFTSLPDVVRHFEWGWLPVGPLITQRFDAGARIADVRVPVLVVHGSDDRLIPPSLGRALFERATAPKRFVLVDGASHHNANAVGLAQVRAALRALYGIDVPS
jgi:alpha-beta hydrolase superfamily lysophospholipase